MLAKTEAAKPAAEEKRRTVTLTNARPVNFLESEWPVIAEGATGFGGDGCLYELTVDFRVRRGKYGSHLIHGKFAWWDESDEESMESIRVGRLVGNDYDVESALLAVGEEMRERVSNERLKRWVTIALDNCFAKLGPQVL